MTDTDRRTEPALTPDEWERFSVWRRQHMIDATNSGPLNIRWNAGGGTPGRHYVELDDGERHAFAALLLYGQPYGFTWDDVYLLRQIATYLDTPEVTASEDGWALDALADRLAALLPPRSP